MRFNVFQPCRALSADVACFIISEQETGLPYTVLPDTALVAGFQYKGRLALVSGSGTQALAAAGITGLQQQYRCFQHMGTTGSVLVKFKPGGTAAFFCPPAHELFEQSLSLDLLAGRHAVSLVEKQLQEAGSDAARISVVESFLLSCRRKDAGEDALVTGAVRLIQQSAGAIRMSALAEQLYTSASPLEKRFRSRIGASPKKFAGIVRLQRIIHCGPYIRGAAAKAYDAGYFDQAHFIKDFRRFSGQTPEAFFAALPPPA